MEPWKNEAGGGLAEVFLQVLGGCCRWVQIT